MIKDLNNLRHNTRLTLILQGVDYAMFGVFEEKNNYIAYKNGELKKTTDKQMLEIKILSVLEQLGYPMDEIGTYFYKNMIVKIVEYLSNNNSIINDKELKNKLKLQLQNAYSQFYLEVAKYDLDIGIKVFHMYVSSANSKIDSSKTESSIIKTIYGEKEEDFDYGEVALMLGEFILNQKNNEQQHKNNIKKLTKQ